MRILSAVFGRLSVVIALIVALATSGFAHQFASLIIDDGLASHIAAGGSLDDLCGDTDRNAGQTCDACRLVDLASVPRDEAIFRGAIDMSAVSRPISGQSLFVSAVPDPARHTRAPPVA